MEGAHLSTSSDSENFFDTKKTKEKDKKKKYESESSNSAEDLNRRRHIAREALRHEGAKESPRIAETKSSAEIAENDEGMDKEERQYAAQMIRRENRQQRHEITPDSNAPAALVAGDLLVEEWDDRIEGGQDLDVALNEILQEHNIELDLADDLPEVSGDSDLGLPELPENEVKTSNEYPLNFSENEIIIHPHTERAGNTKDNKNEEPSWRQLSEVHPSMPPIGPNSGVFEYDKNSPLNENIGPAITPKAETKHVPDYDYGNPAVSAPLGGIIDYFIGRRRGRIRNEKKLLPIQKKLEKQVIDLNWELKAKEAKIRKVAAEHVQRNGPAVLEKMEVESARTKHSQVEHVFEEKSLASFITNRSYEQRQRAPEAKQLHGGQQAPEHIGHVLIAAEAARRSGEAPKTPVTYEKIQLPPNKRIESISRPELLSLSEKIVVEGSTLRQIYETHLIGEQALRRLVAEYLHGGDVPKALQREIVEHEIDFERDPALRDLSVPADTISNDATQVTAPGKEALNQLLQQAEAGLGENDNALAYNKDKSDNAAKQDEQHNQRQIIDVAMATTIVVLVSLVIVLFFWHR